MNPQKAILIIEDEEGIREVMTHALEMYDYDVRTASNGVEALDVLSQCAPPCLILLDLMMPVMDGWRFLDAMKMRFPDKRPPVIVVSAYMDKAPPLGVDATVKKPFALDELLGHVQRFCK